MSAVGRRGWVAGLCLFSTLSAAGGGAALIAFPHGNAYVPVEMLRLTAFDSFLVPGLLLLGVVGGTSLLAAVLVLRRASFAIDALFLAGGTLTIWIIAEVAQLRGIHWLHVIYGLLGASLLALALAAAGRSPIARHRWVSVVTAAETIGFFTPAAVMVLASGAGLGPWLRAALAISAGLIEGLLLGAGQALSFPFGVRRLRYALLTAAGAGVAWAGAMAVIGLAKSTEAPAGAVVAAGLAAGALGLAAIAAAQWFELRRYAAHAARWLGWTALAWVVALPLSFCASPLMDASTPAASQLALLACSGALMAYAMAWVTWRGVRAVARA